MTATLDEPLQAESLNTKDLHLASADNAVFHSSQKSGLISPISSLILPQYLNTHTTQAGLNPLVDSCAYLFSILGKLKFAVQPPPLNELQKELIQEINLFQQAAAQHTYQSEYLMISRYILAATFDDVISNTAWGGNNQWEPYQLLNAFNLDNEHQHKFFTILERALQEPATYADLMELIYLCLSMGYKGQYRGTEHSQYQLEQITNHLYQHIRAYRGHFSKSLSPVSIKSARVPEASMPPAHLSWVSIFLFTACIMMTIFIGLGYLTDIIANEAYKDIAQIEQATFSLKA